MANNPMGPEVKDGLLCIGARHSLIGFPLSSPTSSILLLDTRVSLIES